MEKTVKSQEPLKNKRINTETIEHREHAEFHNCYTNQSLLDDISFLNTVYGDKVSIKKDDISNDLINNLKHIGKEIYFFILGLEEDITPQEYLKRKNDFIKTVVPDANKDLFYLAWNGLIKNDSFKRLLLQKFSLQQFNNKMSPRNIPFIGASKSRYRNKLVLADDMARDIKGNRRKEGRLLDDGSGLKMKEGIVWLPNDKAMPIFPQAYVPLNQTQLILIRHGRSVHNSGGDDPVFVGSGYWDTWENNRRIANSIGNYLHEDGIKTAKELGKDFKVVVETLSEAGYPLWSWSKDNPVPVFGSESENTEQTARYFLNEAGYSNIMFSAVWGLNSQKYGALTHMSKSKLYEDYLKVSKLNWGKNDKEKIANVKKSLKNRFYHYPEGETLIEADWRIAYSFTDLLKKNQGKRIMLTDHSGAIRVFTAIIKALDFADYSGLKEAQDSIMALNYQPGKNVRYDYIQKAEFPLRKK